LGFSDSERREFLHGPLEGEFRLLELGLGAEELPARRDILVEEFFLLIEGLLAKLQERRRLEVIRFGLPEGGRFEDGQRGARFDLLAEDGRDLADHPGDARRHPRELRRRVLGFGVRADGFRQRPHLQRLELKVRRARRVGRQRHADQRVGALPFLRLALTRDERAAARELRIARLARREGRLMLLAPVGPVSGFPRPRELPVVRGEREEPDQDRKHDGGRHRLAHRYLSLPQSSQTSRSALSPGSNPQVLQKS
jgi:hypothetical protein